MKNREIKFRAWMKNREIKFMAWHKEDEIMYDVESLIYNNGELFGVTLSSMNHEIVGWVDEDAPKVFFIDAIELIQYTGLEDRNGVEIYIGDILVPNDGDVKRCEKFIVALGEYNCKNYGNIGNGFYLKHFIHSGDITMLHSSKLRELDLKVIGNIHDNPDLLSKNKNKNESKENNLF